MKFTLPDLWRPSGKVNRGAYALVGFIGFAIKHNMDRVVATLIFHRPWDLFNYWVPLRDVRRITDLRSADARFLEAMLAFALPFIWVGVVMTLKRLRSARLPTWMVLLFFAPFLNVPFFLLLCVIPERNANPLRDSGESWLVRLLPRSALGSAVVSLLVTAPVGYAIYLLGAMAFNVYGWGIFVALPFTMGFGAGLLYGARAPRSLTSYLLVAALTTVAAAAMLIGFAVEGVVCLYMAFPIGLLIALLGGASAYCVQRWCRPGNSAPALAGMLLVLAPGVQSIEYVLHRSADVFVVRSSVDIQAAPQAVWKQVIAFSQIPPPKELMFRAGIAFPIRAEMIAAVRARSGTVYFPPARSSSRFRSGMSRTC